MTVIRIMGIDPGLAHMGVAGLLFDPDQGYALDFVSLIVTKKSTKKKGLRAKADDVRRLEKVVAQFGALVVEWLPDVFSFEAVPSIRNAMVARKSALSWGACFALARQRQGALILEYDPQPLKEVATGDKNASKEKMIQVLSERFPVLAASTTPKSKKEHEADAVAAALKAAQDPAVIALAQALKRVTQ